MNDVYAASGDDEIAELERELRKAQLTSDIAALDRLISDDLLFAGPDGRLATKAQDLDAHRTGIVRFRKHEPRQLRVRRVGKNVAIASLETVLEVQVADDISSGTFRYTRVWAREKGGGWRVVGGHVSEIGRAQVP